MAEIQILRRQARRGSEWNDQGRFVLIKSLDPSCNCERFCGRYVTPMREVVTAATWRLKVRGSGVTTDSYWTIYCVVNGI